jgi:glycosylphosphatidylinositol transamidase
MLNTVFIIFAVFSNILPFILSTAITHYFSPTTQQYLLIKSFSLLLLGLFLSSLATLNFSLAFLVGLLAAPLTYIQPIPSSSIVVIAGTGALALLLAGISPTTVLAAGSWAWGWTVKEVLLQAAFGWDVWGMNTQVVVWCVWWPAWVMGGVLLFGRPRRDGGDKEIEKK